jgi:hypothetical protein
MYKFDWDKHPRSKSMTDLQYLLCPPRVLGYALKQKNWAQLLVDGLRKPDAADAGTFEDKLQLDEDFKDLIKKSVQAHELGKQKDSRGRFKALEDFAPEKGKGLIIMLYGKRNRHSNFSPLRFQKVKFMGHTWDILLQDHAKNEKDSLV